MQQSTAFKPLFFIFAMGCASHWLSAQVKIELGRMISYSSPSGEPENIPGKKRVLTNNPWERLGDGFGLNCFIGFKFTEDELERIFDGTAKVHNYSNDIIKTGMYYFKYDSEGFSGFFHLWFPSVKNIKKIEFFDKDGNKMFEDLFEERSLFDFSIVKASANSFSFSATPEESWPDVHFSSDRAKTWEWVKVDYGTNTFSVPNDIANSPDLVIVATAHGLTPPHAVGVALWAPNPSDYVFEFADDEEPAPQVAPTALPSNNPNTNKGFLSRIFGK